MSCFHRLPREWCFDTNAMAVEIAESYFYNKEMSKRHYNFSIEVNPICDDSPFGKDIKARQGSYLQFIFIINGFTWRCVLQFTLLF